MNRTNKKGFTLVELLVVIAILAILATVSVVGYTAFIERASVSNDENVAAQLNQFLTAMKADSTGDFYNQPVTKDNVWKVVDTMLKENGTLTELKPQSLDYGYHYFFDITDQKFIVLKEKDAGITTSGFKAIQGVGLSTVAAGEEAKPGFFEYKTTDAAGEAVTHTIFLIDTKGSSLAIAVRGFYTLEGIGEEGDDPWDIFKNALEDSKNQQNNTDYANKTIFVTKDGNKTTDDTTDKTNAVVHEGATSITTDKEDGTKVDFSKIEKIDVPESVEAIGNDFLNQFGTNLAEGKKPEVSTTKTAEELADAMAKSNDGADRTIEVKITDGNTTVEIKITIKSNTNSVTDKDDQLIAEGSFKNPANKVELSVVEVSNKVKVVDGVVYVAWDYALNSANKIKFNFKATGDKANLPASYDKVVWEDNDGNEFDFSSVDRTAGKTVKVSLQNADSEDPLSYTTLASASVTVKFVYFTSGTVKINNSDKFELENDDQNGGNTDFVVTLNNLSQNTTVDDIVLDTSFVLTTESTKLATDGTKFNLKDVKDLYDATHLNAKVGGYFNIGFDVKVYSKSNLTFVATALAKQIKYIGDLNDITVGDLFDLNSGMTVPTNAMLWFGSGWADDSTMPGAVEKKVTDPTKHALVDETTNTSITSTGFTANKLRFKDGANNPSASEWKTVDCYIVIPTGDGTTYRRISPVVTLQVVDAYNLFASDIPADENSNWTHAIFNKNPDTDHKAAPMASHTEDTCKDTANYHKVTNISVVLLGNYTVPKEGYLTLGEGKTLYGNLFTINLSKARNNSQGMIELSKNASILDTVIIGQAYSSEEDPWYSGITWSGFVKCQSGTAATVRVIGENALISNCYISGGRAPLRLASQNAKIINTVLFGGAFATIDSQASSFTLENVVTVNQYHSVYNSKIGGGIVISGDSNAIKNTVIQIKGTFNQYNFVAQDETSYFANSTLGSGVGAFFTESATKDRFVFTDSSNKQYGHSGIIYDKNANDSLNDGSGNVDINIKVWDESSNSYVKKLPTGYGSAAINKTVLGIGVKITAAALDKNAVGSGFDVSEYTTKTEFYAPSLVNTDNHYKLTFQE